MSANASDPYVALDAAIAHSVEAEVELVQAMRVALREGLSREAVAARVREKLSRPELIRGM